MTGLSPFVIYTTSILMKQTVLNKIKIPIYRFIFFLICYSKHKILKYLPYHVFFRFLPFNLAIKEVLYDLI